ncbi:aspartate aminotransferase family protein [Pseudomonas sp. LABIM340]|uniref:Aspartate aminotransferase family protein n=2 Tax=Pseudomonadaceae TaxID=135621 RepID=A0A5R9ACZ0_PSENT|nr:MULTISPECIES: aspartate aminotransferase family protein [Pseudomonadaceae]MBD9515127.1 aspartate aminotransferase family protein [Pseudomonas sp. PDM22]MBD9634468.1 aspartate aminotransferase family protein [Pseudomonas sp. PDM19]MBD9685982.1 aspartate aminotransferase family protein [Pseudomonas sp. PDM20]QEY74395.1 aspartate aminotransferase family protein [Pseudomonas denitrificans (nom. rej.)]TLP76662.1 aspartate aminotransferase family protein [Pseudomonas nitroreducens]
MTDPKRAPRDTREYQKADAAHHIHAFLDQKALNAEGPRVMVRGEGLHLWDNDGNKYIDGMSGLWCTNLGYGRKDLTAAATAQLDELPYYNMFFHTTHPAVIELSETLFSLLPDHYSHAIYTNSGSEANEVLIRTVRRFWQIEGKPQKKIMIGRWNGYHGSTLAATALGGMKFMHEMGGLIPDIAHIDEPYFFAAGGDLTPAEFGRRCALQLEEKILELGADNVAGFIAEPFQGAGGMIFPPESYWPEIQRICRQYDVLLCADEVIGGFGRTGEWFAHQHFGFQPDTLSIAKGLTSGYIPMGGLVLSKRIAQALVEEGGVFAHGLTYSGHPVAAAVAVANLRALRDEGWVNAVKNDTGPYLQQCLREVFGNHPLVGDIQGTGFVAALQFVQDKATRKRFDNENDIAWRCRTIGFEEGVIIRSTLGRMIMAPALVAGRAEIDELVDKTRRAVDRTAQEIGVL